jgi:ribose 5-phosphate isomerase A
VNNDTQQALKRQAGEYAVDNFIESGMVVGLGHGSTAIWATRRLAELLDSGELKDIVAIPCSVVVEKEARALNIPLTDFATHPEINVTIDGADEVDSNLQLIKGGGGALLREKIVAQASRRVVIVVDESKLSPVLGIKFALPVEVIPFGWQSQYQNIKSLGAKITLRKDEDGHPFVTDQGNYILDCRFLSIEEPHLVAATLNTLATVVEHGLFLDIATDLVIARPAGIEHQCVIVSDKP